MSRPQEFKDLPAALAAFAAGQCRRWVMVDGWQIDLSQAKDEAGRVREEEPTDADYLASVRELNAIGEDGAAWDRFAAQNVAAELARASGVLPELAVPKCGASGGAPVGDVPVPSETAPDASAYRCPWCSRPWDGAP